MPNPAAKYTDEFRRETADYIISTGRPITEYCAELGLNSKTVNKWVQNRRRELAGGPDPKAEDRELREAKRRIRELEMENAEFPVKPRPDLVRRDFTSPVPTYKLVGDITYLRIGEGWLYLSPVIDLSTRMVVGWSLSERMTADIAVSALTSAKSRGYVAGNAIFHADRGAHRASRLLAEWARDNAVAGSFFATLKNEVCYRRSFPTRDSAKHAVIEFIEAYYNRRRPHSAIGCKVPAEAMAAFSERTEPKPEAMPMAA